MTRPSVAATATLLATAHAGRPVVLVPTMGGLHAGHLALVRRARELADALDGVVCVSVFVNPLQFGPAEDYDTYPRRLDADLDALAGLADTCFAPSVATMYPEPQQVFVDAPGLGGELCGAHRPGFFTGVLTVVHKLFALVKPGHAVFGTKDYQQLVLVRRMCGQLHLPVEITAVDTVRDADGLALSSRNGGLAAAARAVAPELHKQLLLAGHQVAGGMDHAAACARASASLLAAGFTAVDYVECRALDDLAPFPGGQAGFVVLGAAHLDGVRLIDNVPVPR